MFRRFLRDGVFVFLCHSTVSAQAVIYVDSAAPPAGDGTSWGTAFQQLQDGIDAAVAGDQVWVAEGVYTPTEQLLDNPRSVRFVLKANVAVYGGFESGATMLSEQDPQSFPTVLSGDLNGDDSPDFLNRSDNAWRVIEYDGSTHDEPTTLDGFTISGGYTEFLDDGAGLYVAGAPIIVRSCLFTDNHAFGDGGGALVKSADATFEGCSFIGNRAPGDGAGLSLDVNNSHVVVHDCVFEDNYSGAPFNPGGNGGGLYVNSVSIDIARCQFKSNTAGQSGGGALLSNTQAGEIVECHFVENISEERGGGLFFTGSLIQRCAFMRNESGIEGGGVTIGATVVENCKIIGNSCSNGIGGGISIRSGKEQFPGIVVNSTVAYNIASEVGGGIALADVGRVGSVHNSIVWGNTDSGGVHDASQVSGGVQIEVTYSCVQDFASPRNDCGNLGLDPLFMDPLGLDGIPGTEDDDYRVQPASPCINGGDPATEIAKGAVDLDGNPRLGSCSVDMGAYESTEIGIDCDLTGTNDHCDMIDGASDCNQTSVLDVCELAAGSSSDVDLDGVPDDCQVLWEISGADVTHQMFLKNAGRLARAPIGGDVFVTRVSPINRVYTVDSPVCGVPAISPPVRDLGPIDVWGIAAEDLLIAAGTSDSAMGEILWLRPDGSTTHIVEPTPTFSTLNDMLIIQETGRFILAPTSGEDVLVTTLGGKVNVLFSGPAGSSPLTLARGTDGRIFSLWSDGVVRIHDDSGALVDDDFSVLPAGQRIPLAVGSGGPWGTDLYAFVDGSEVLRIRSDGSSEIVATSADDSGVAQDALFDSEGCLLVSITDADHPNNDRIDKFCPVACDADTNGDATVDVIDLLNLLAAWGTCEFPCPPYCEGDVNQDCQVNVSDLLDLLANWGPCLGAG